MSRREIEIGVRISHALRFTSNETRCKAWNASRVETHPRRRRKIGRIQRSSVLYLAQYRRRKRGFTAPVPHGNGTTLRDYTAAITSGDLKVLFPSWRELLIAIAEIVDRISPQSTPPTTRVAANTVRLTKKRCNTLFSVLLWRIANYLTPEINAN